MSVEWPEVSVEEIAAPCPNSLATGPFGSAISSKFFVAEGVPVIRGSNLSTDIETKLNDEGIIFVSEEKAKSFSRSVVRRGDLIFTCWGTINQVGMIHEWSRWEEYIISNKQMKLTVDPLRADPKFVYYVFSSPSKQSEILANGIGAAVPGFNLGQLKKHTFRLPPLNVQQKIVKSLDLLDRKIQTNHQINQTLEQMAQAIFKSWFVDFDPVKAKIAARKRWLALQPRAEPASPVCYAGEADILPDLETYMTLAAMQAISGKGEKQLICFEAEQPEQYAELRATAELFPSAMQESDLGEIPEGWGHVRLDHYIELAYGKALKKTSRVEGMYPVYGSGGITGAHNECLVPGPGIIVGRKGTVGSIYWESRDFYPIDTTYFVSVRNGCSLLFAYYLLRTLGLEDMNTDAAVPGLNRNNVYRLEVPSYPRPVVEKFTAVVESISKKVAASNSETHSLAKLRDLLLPRLLTGELSISGVLGRADEDAVEATHV